MQPRFRSILRPACSPRRPASGWAVGTALCALLLAGCGGLQSGTPDDSTTLSSKVRTDPPTTTAAASSAPASASPSASSSGDPFCSLVRQHFSQLSRFPATPQQAQAAQPLWSAVSAAAPTGVRTVLAALEASVGQIAAGQGQDVDAALVSRELTTVSSWVTANCPS